MTKQAKKPEPEAAGEHEEILVRVARRGDRHRVEVTIKRDGGERKFTPKTSGGKPVSKLRASGYVGDAHQLLTLWVSGRQDLTAWEEVKS